MKNTLRITGIFAVVLNVSVEKKRNKMGNVQELIHHNLKIKKGRNHTHKMIYFYDRHDRNSKSIFSLSVTLTFSQFIFQATFVSATHYSDLTLSLHFPEFLMNHAFAKISISFGVTFLYGFILAN